MELKVSVVVTVKNDKVGIVKLKKALDRQTVKSDELVVIRAEEHGNCSRGKGRNIGVRMARNQVIAVTDAGCRPHPDWLENLVRCLETDKSYKDYKNYKKDNDNSFLSIAIAGWYRVAAGTDLQRAMAGFLTPISVDSIKDSPWHTPGRILSAILPASRSIMFTKAAWAAVGGYPEEAISGAEDLEFGRRLAAHPRVKMIYCPQALVDWELPATLGEFFRDIVKHTRGNVEVGYRPHLWRNLTVVGRWMAIGLWPWLGIFYLVWVIKKGIKVIKVINIINIPQIVIVQLVADGGVILGLILGILGKLGGIRGEGKEGKEGGRQNRL